MKKIVILLMLIQLDLIGQDSLFVSGSIVTIKTPYSTLTIPDFNFSVVNTTNYVRIKNGNIEVYEGRLSNIWIAEQSTNTQKIKFLRGIFNSIFLTIEINAETTLVGNTYKEVSILPMNGGSYTLAISGSSPITGISSITNFRSEKGVITNSITITPSGGSILYIGTKK